MVRTRTGFHGGEESMAPRPHSSPPRRCHRLVKLRDKVLNPTSVSMVPSSDIVLFRSNPTSSPEPDFQELSPEEFFDASSSPKLHSDGLDMNHDDEIPDQDEIPESAPFVATDDFAPLSETAQVNPEGMCDSEFGDLMSLRNVSLPVPTQKSQESSPVKAAPKKSSVSKGSSVRYVPPREPSMPKYLFPKSADPKGKRKISDTVDDTEFEAPVSRETSLSEGTQEVSAPKKERSKEAAQHPQRTKKTKTVESIHRPQTRSSVSKASGKSSASSRVVDIKGENLEYDYVILDGGTSPALSSQDAGSSTASQDVLVAEVRHLITAQKRMHATLDKMLSQQDKMLSQQAEIKDLVYAFIGSDPPHSS